MRNSKFNVGRSRRPKKALGGNVTYGSEITSKDISNKDVNNAGIQGASIGKGTLSGAAAGASIGSIIPGIGTVIGGAVGAIGGFFAGLFGGRRKARKAKEAEAAAREQERQHTLANMQIRADQDAMQLRQSDLANVETTGYYAQKGGLIPSRWIGRMYPRNKYATGGLAANSSNTIVAFGNTHEQVDPQTGETGIQYGNAEVEGGGFNSQGQPIAGEVIKEQGDSAMVFSDTLKMPGTTKTFAAIAKNITSKRGRLEKQVKALGGQINLALDALENPMFVAKRGTSERNIEKSAIDMDTLVGKIAELDNQENTLYNVQETYATEAGLRDDVEVQMRHGGKTNRMDFGGLMALSNFALNGINAWQTGQAIDREAGFAVPQRATVKAPEYQTNYSISPQLEVLDADKSAAKAYIQNNTNNAAVARANYANLTANIGRVRGQYYQAKNAADNEIYNKNIEAQFQTSQYNNEINYQNRLDKYNKQVNINSARSANQRQFLQSSANLLGDIANYKMQQYQIGATALTSASEGDAARLQNLYDSIFGTDVSGAANTIGNAVTTVGRGIGNAGRAVGRWTGSLFGKRYGGSVPKRMRK